jgi:hypothetical protein
VAATKSDSKGTSKTTKQGTGLFSPPDLKQTHSKTTPADRGQLVKTASKGGTASPSLVFEGLKGLSTPLAVT